MEPKVLSVPTIRLHRPKFRAVILSFSLAVLAGCADSFTGPGPSDVPSTSSSAGGSAGFAGFDSYGYRGSLPLWINVANPRYTWMGFYLPAPCNKDDSSNSYLLQRQSIEDAGWGLAVLYVGRQFSNNSPCPVQSVTQGTSYGAIDAADAIKGANSERFLDGTIIYLDIEDPLPTFLAKDPMYAYVTTWVGEMRKSKFRPGIYVHTGKTATDVYDAMVKLFGQAPSMWVFGNSTTGAGFDVTKAPSASGHSYAAIWQGIPQNIKVTFNGLTVNGIDEDVATSRSPSIDVDLTITSLTTKITLGHVVFSATVRNKGTAMTQATSIKAYASSSQNLNGNPFDLKCDFAIWRLAAGETRTDSWDCAIPSGAPTASTYLLAYVDSPSRNTESDELNNIGSTNSKVTLMVAQPDWTITAVSATTQSASVGSSIGVTSMLRNSGQIAASTATIKYYVATKQDLSGTEYDLNCNKDVATLASQGSRSEAQTCTIPTGIPAGSYYILAYVDFNNRVAESNEQNNIGSTANKVTISLPKPSVPTGLNPGSTNSPGAVTSSKTVSLRWNASSGATSYAVAVRNMITNKVTDYTTSGVSFAVTLSATTKYRWNVSACNATGCSAYASAVYFQTPK